MFENDSITNIAHQLGYFETIASWRDVHAMAGRIEAVTLDQVAEVAAQRLGSVEPHDRLVRAGRGANDRACPAAASRGSGAVPRMCSPTA